MSKRLKNVYDAAVAKLGSELPLAIARSYGAVHGVEDTPANRADGLAAALNRILRAGGRVSMAQAKALVHGAPAPTAPKAQREAVSEQDDVFAAIRAEAFRPKLVEPESEAKAEPLLDYSSIMARWNASKRVKTD
jgi:hypothetical protein